MRKRLLVLAMALVLGSSACTSEGGAPDAHVTPTLEHERGGTLRVSSLPVGTPAFDPKAAYHPSRFVWRCCLARTLISFSGRPADEGGAVPRPDLATALPEVSADGLRWTFSLKQGLRYAPPYEDVEIVAEDIVRALERRSKHWTGPNGYDFLYAPIVGFEEFWAGEADSISGLEAPDEHRLVVNLEEPTGDLAYRFSMPPTAPVPQGAADGHGADYGRFFASSGPYMIEGSEALDPTLPPEQQQPVAGFVPGESLALVRNPSWDPTTDALRPAYADRIEFTFEPWDLMKDPEMQDRHTAAILSGALDVDLFATEPSQLERYPSEQVRLDSDMGSTYLPMNLAVPPFDDLHVRKSVALVVDRAAIAAEMNEVWSPMEMRWHIAPDGTEGGLLTDWQPEWWSSAEGDLEAARAEMALSAYDTDGDGRCDATACDHVRALVQAWEPEWSPGFHWVPVRDALRDIGITLDVTEEGYEEVGTLMGEPRRRWGLIVSWEWTTWAPGFPNGSRFFVPLLSSSSISEEGSKNLSLVGASADQLEAWGYPITEVPSVDERLDRCLDLTFSDQERCWADLDMYLMNELVPWVPLPFAYAAMPVSERVVHYSFDPSTHWPAFEQIALAPGSE